MINQAITLDGNEHIQAPSFGPLTAWTESIWVDLLSNAIQYLLDGRNNGSRYSSNVSLFNGGNAVYTRVERWAGRLRLQRPVRHQLPAVA